MKIYDFAGINVGVSTRYDFLRKLCADYETNAATPDITVSVTDEQMKAEKNVNDYAANAGYIESVCAYRNIVKAIIPFDAFMLHGATFRVGDRCLSLVAKSGTGKTTHMKLWMQLLGDRITVINGDKPIIRFRNGIPVAYGTPFMGKEGDGCRTSAPLTDICFIERSPTNSTRKILPQEAVNLILNQIIFPDKADDMLKLLDMIDKLLNICSLWEIKCNMEPEAAQCAYNAVFKEMT